MVDVTPCSLAQGSTDIRSRRILTL